MLSPRKFGPISIYRRIYNQRPYWNPYKEDTTLLSIMRQDIKQLIYTRDRVKEYDPQWCAIKYGVISDDYRSKTKEMESLNI